MISFLTSIAAIMIPLFLAGMGGMLSDRAGKLNIGLEGLILAGSFTAYASLRAGLPFFPALLTASLAGAMGGALLALVHLKGRANLFISGLALNLLIPSLLTTLSQNLYQTRGVLRLPFSGGLFSAGGLPLFLPLCLVLAAIIPLILGRTQIGLNLSASGVSPALLQLRGSRPERYQAAALAASGLLCGAAGAFLAFRLGAYVPGMSAGRGWTALVIVYLGFRHPAGIAGAALVYALAEGAAILMQGAWNLPVAFLLALPYLIMLLFLILGRFIRFSLKAGEKTL